MAQWFKKLVIKFFGIKPYSAPLAIEQLDSEVERCALGIRSYYNDEGVQAILKLLKIEHTRHLYMLTSFNGDAVRLAKMQGQVETVLRFITFIEQSGSMPAEQANKLRKDKQENNKKNSVLKFSKSNRNDVVI